MKWDQSHTHTQLYFMTLHSSSNPRPSGVTKAADFFVKFRGGSGGGVRVQNHSLPNLVDVYFSNVFKTISSIY